MTEQPYESRLTSFKTGLEAAPIKTYPVVANGREELKKVCLGDYSLGHFAIESLNHFAIESLNHSAIESLNHFAIESLNH